MLIKQMSTAFGQSRDSFLLDGGYISLIQGP